MDRYRRGWGYRNRRGADGRMTGMRGQNAEGGEHGRVEACISSVCFSSSHAMLDQRPLQGENDHAHDHAPRSGRSRRTVTARGDEGRRSDCCEWIPR
jgi:hypothetical protein